MSFYDDILIGSGASRLMVTVALEFGPLTEPQVKEIQTIVGNYDLKG